jgi:hypothetical protein
MDAIKNPRAPNAVPRLARSPWAAKPVEGLTNDATAEIPKASEPNTFKAAIHQSRSRGRYDNHRCSEFASVSTLESRKHPEPIMFGAHTRTFA